MLFIENLLLTALGQVWHTFSVNWPFLVIGSVLAAAMKVYADPERASAFLQRHQGKGVVAATLVGATTPLCSCGTTAVVLGMMASQMPWAPVVAFMVASPLTSPEELVFSAGLFGWTFALTFFVAAIVLGLAGGGIAHALEKRGWLANQARIRNTVKETSASPFKVVSADESAQRETAIATEAGARSDSCGCAGSNSENPAGGRQRTSILLWHEFLVTGRRLLLMFLGFAFIGYVLNGLIPADIIATLFGSGRRYGVALAATLGLPLYVNTEASLPLLRSFLDAGMSQGAALAFLITGAGTSIGAIAGALTIARWRVVALVIAVLWVGAIIFGYGYNALVAAGAF